MAKNILVVDDEPDVLKVLLLRLEKTGYEVIGGRDGQETLNLAHWIIPDLIVLDFCLPDMNGDYLTRMIKRDTKLKHISIILIFATTAFAAERVKDCGANGYIAKPFEPKELIGAVKKALG